MRHLLTFKFYFCIYILFIGLGHLNDGRILALPLDTSCIRNTTPRPRAPIGPTLKSDVTSPDDVCRWRNHVPTDVTDAPPAR